MGLNAPWLDFGPLVVYTSGQFWEDNSEGFSSWWKQLQTPDQRLILSMPVDEVPATLHGKYDLRGAYSVVRP